MDWEDLDNADLLRHHNEQNDASTVLEPLLSSDDLPPPTRQPQHLSLVEVPSADCPLTNEEIDILNDHLVQLPQTHSRHMRDRRSLWIEALSFCRTVFFGESQV